MLIFLFFFIKFEVEAFLEQGRQSRKTDGAICRPLIFKTTKEPFFQHKNALFEYKSAFFHDENQLLTSLFLLTPAPSKLISV